MNETRINKYIALCGICSRREADTLIEAGRVFINGEKAELGSKVVEGDLVKILLVKHFIILPDLHMPDVLMRIPRDCFL